MEKMVIARDDQQASADDFNNAQSYTRQAMDHVVRDGISPSKHYTGFTVTKKTATTITVQGGLFYSGGKVYAQADAQDIDLFTRLATSTKRKVLIAVYGQDIETDIEPRDFLVDAENDVWEPQSVAMTALRYAVVDNIGGAEGADPQVPGTPSTHVGVAVVTLDNEEILSVEMLTDNVLPSVYDNDQRLATVEATLALLLPTVSTMASEIASLKAALANSASRVAFLAMAQDLAILKEILDEPDTYVNWGADRFLTEDESDTEFSGYAALVEEGVRFPVAASDTGALKLNNPTDPLVKSTNNLTLPKWTEVTRIALTGYSGERSISQYTAQTLSTVQLTRTRRRIRFGETKTICTNSQWWQRGTYDPLSNTLTYQGETWEVLDGDDLEAAMRNGRYPAHKFFRIRRFWEDTVEEPYWDKVVVESDITGKSVAQTFLNAQEGWLTSIDLKLTRIDPDNNIEVLVVETTKNAEPDITRVIARTTLDGEDTLQFVPETGSGKTNVPLTPTFLESGKRYAIVLITGGDYYTALTTQGAAINGTFFSATDGAYFAGDAANDMLINLNFAKFQSNRVEVSLGWKTLNALELSGGMMDIDILAETILPKSTQLIFEVQVGGVWIPLAETDAAVLASAPNLAAIRAVFVGTLDVMPAIRLDTSQCVVSRPDDEFVHISTERTVATDIDTVVVALDLEDFDETPHNCVITVLVTGGSEETADAVEDKVIGPRAIRRTATFSFTNTDTGYRVKIAGATNSIASTYHVAQRTDVATLVS